MSATLTGTLPSPRFIGLAPAGLERWPGTGRWQVAHLLPYQELYADKAYPNTVEADARAAVHRDDAGQEAEEPDSSRCRRSGCPAPSAGASTSSPSSLWIEEKNRHRRGPKGTFFQGVSSMLWAPGDRHVDAECLATKRLIIAIFHRHRPQQNGSEFGYRFIINRLSCKANLKVYRKLSFHVRPSQQPRCLPLLVLTGVLVVTGARRSPGTDNRG